MLKWIVIPAVSLLAMLPTASNAQLACAIPATTVNALQAKLAIVINENNGGLFSPNEMWSAIVDRTGKLCSVIASSPDAWPGSRAIAIAKATTANGFSNNKLALSTANLYAPTQPGGSLYGFAPESRGFMPLAATAINGLYLASAFTGGGGFTGAILGGGWAARAAMHADSTTQTPMRTNV